MQNTNELRFNIPTLSKLTNDELKNKYLDLLSYHDPHTIENMNSVKLLDHLETYLEVVHKEDMYLTFYELLDSNGQLTGEYYTGNNYLNVNFRVVFKPVNLNTIKDDIVKPEVRAFNIATDFSICEQEMHEIILISFNFHGNDTYVDYYILKKREDYATLSLDYILSEKEVDHLFSKGLTNKELFAFFNIYLVNNPGSQLNIEIGWHESNNDNINNKEIVSCSRDMIPEILEFDIRSCDWIEFDCGFGITYYIDFDRYGTKKWSVTEKF